MNLGDIANFENKKNKIHATFENKNHSTQEITNRINELSEDSQDKISYKTNKKTVKIVELLKNEEHNENTQSKYAINSHFTSNIDHSDINEKTASKSMSGLLSDLNAVNETANKFYEISGTIGNLNEHNQNNTRSGILSKVNSVAETANKFGVIPAKINSIFPQASNKFSLPGLSNNINKISNNFGMHSGLNSNFFAKSASTNSFGTMSSFMNPVNSGHPQSANNIGLLAGLSNHINSVFPQSTNKISYISGLANNTKAFIPQSMNKFGFNNIGPASNSNSINYQLSSKINPLSTGFLGLTSVLLSSYDTQFKDEYEVTYITRSKHLNKLMTIFIRLALLLIGGYYSYFLWCTQNIYYLCLLLLSLVIFCDTFYVSFVRLGIDFKW